MTSLEKVHQWLEDMEVKIQQEEDAMEKRLLWQEKNSLELNIKYYIPGQLEKGTPHFFCKECGRIEFATYSPDVKKRLEDNQHCYHCDFWVQREKEYLSKGFLIVNGCVYSDAGNTKGKNTAYNGFAGSVFKIRMLDRSKEWETNNLWCGGDIPKKYRMTTMKDNAEFIKDDKPAFDLNDLNPLD
nr:MAG TPA: hypothetical protein [Caudoviricetes sp.]